MIKNNFVNLNKIVNALLVGASELDYLTISYLY